MKKFAKMSLVAAVAVAGMTSASAKDLTEAIKGVDVSGTVVYRYDDRKDENTNSATNNNYKVAATLKSPVNDDVTFTSRFLVTTSATGNFATLNTDSNADANPGVSLSWANFTYTGLANTSVIVGKQGLGTPWTNAVDSDGSEETGTGILALTTMGPVTAAAGYFNQTNLNTSVGLGYAGADSVVAALIAKFAGVNVEAWYLDVQDTADSVFLAANTSFKAGDVTLGLDAKWTTADLDNDSPDADLGNWEAGITAKLGIFNAGFAYAESDKDGDAIFNSVAKNGQIGYTANLNSTDDAEMIMVDLGAQVTPELHIGLNYDSVEDNTAGSTADDHDETYVQVTYNMSKNLSTYVRYADGEDGTVDYKRGRLQVQYSF